MEPERLALLPDDRLWEYVRARIDPHHDWSPWLKGPVIPRVREILLRAWARMDDEHRQRGRELTEAQLEQFRRSAAGPRRRLQARQAEVRAAMKLYNLEQAALQEAARDRLMARTLRALTIEVVTHRRTMLEADMAPTAADIRLWQCLRWLKISAGTTQVSLQQMFDEYWDEPDDEQEDERAEA